MKTAICFSGHMRSYKKTLSYIKNQLLDPIQPDVFIHTWKDNTTDWSDIIKQYNQKSIYIEDPIKFIDNYPNKHFTSQHIKSNLGVIAMYYKIYKCNQLKIEQEKINDQKYDCVIRIRPDGILNNKFNIETNYSNNIYLTTMGPEKTWVDDTFAHSTSENMDLYSNVYLHLDEFYNKEQSLHPETILRLCLEKYNLNAKLNENKFAVLRENDRIESHLFTGEVDDFLKI